MARRSRSCAAPLVLLRAAFTTAPAAQTTWCVNLLTSGMLLVGP